MREEFTFTSESSVTLSCLCMIPSTAYTNDVLETPLRCGDGTSEYSNGVRSGQARKLPTCVWMFSTPYSDISGVS